MAVDNRQLQEAAEALTQARLIAVSSGAGISKESGVPTFRDAQEGLWAKYDPEQLATPSAFRRDPDLVWSWYLFRAALVELESLAPKVVVLTQNVDGLHARAGSSDIVELHGRLGRVKCFAACRGEPTLVELASVPHDDQHAPACPYCNDKLRPDVVWFGEALPDGALERAVRTAQDCDAMIVVGTSGVVQPAASLPYYAREAGATIIDVNPAPSLITRDAHIFLEGPSGQVLPRLIEAVRDRRHSSA